MRAMCGLFGAMLVIGVGCGGSSPKPDATPEALAPALEAKALTGPFADVAAFCQSLGHDACDVTTSAIMATPDRYKPKPFGAAGEVGFKRASSMQGNIRHAYILFEQGDKLWALPSVSTYDTQSGLGVDVSVISFEPINEDKQVGRLWLSKMLEDTPGGQTEVEEWQTFCKFDAAKAPSCLQINTVTAKAPSMMAGDLLEAGSVFAIYKEPGRIEINESMVPSETEARQAKLLKPGLYPIRFE